MDGTPSSMNRVLFLTIWPVEKTGRHPSSRREMHIVELMLPTHSTSSDRPALQIAPHTITEKSPCLTVGCNRFKENSLLGSLQPHTRPLSEKLSKFGLMWKNDSLPKLQGSGGNLINPLLSPLNAGWSKKRFSPRYSSILAQLMKVPHSSSWANLDLLCNICLATGSFLNGSLDSSKTSFWGPRSTRTGCCGFLAFAGELHNHPIDRRKRNAKVLGYLTLADSNFWLANNSSSLKIAKVVCSLDLRHS